MKAVASQAYLIQHGEPSHPRQLRNHSCIISNNELWKFDIDGQPENIKVKGRWRSNNANAVLDACERGLGIAYMPQSTLTLALEAGRLLPILAPYWSKGASSWIVYQNKRFMPQRVRLAIDYLVQHFAQWQE